MKTKGPIVAGLLFALAGGVLSVARGETSPSAESTERSRAMRLRTVGRAEFLPDLMPPSGPVVSDTLALTDGTEIRWGVGAGMDRVDGFRPLLRLDLRGRGRLPRIDLQGSYGTSSERWSGAAFVAFRLGSTVRVGARVFDETAPFPDALRPVTSEENFLAALLLREDYLDYLHRRGGAAVFYWRPEPRRESQILLVREDQRARERARRLLGPFGGRKEFRENPAVPEQTWGYARVRQLWTSRSWQGSWEREDARAALAEVVIGAKGLGSSVDFARFVLEFRGRQRLALNQFFAYKLNLGSGQTEGPIALARESGVSATAGALPDLPRAWWFQSGGIGTLRAHDLHQFTGDRQILGTIEYGLELGHQVRPVVFLDSGRTWVSRVRRVGGIWGSGPFLIDGGVGLQLGAGPLSGRVDVARDLREARAPARVSFRLGYPF